MAIEIKETFHVRAPLDAVWRFLIDPQQVVTCVPGASLDSAVDENTYLGTVKVKVGAITTAYKGKVQFTKRDETAGMMEMVAEGRETGGGLAKGTMTGRLRRLPDGQTEVVAEATVDLTGRIMQVGRGMIQGVAGQLFQQFVGAVKQRLETAEAAAAAGAPAPSAPSTPAEPQAIRILPILLRAVRDAVVRFFRRLFGREDGGK